MEAATRSNKKYTTNSTTPATKSALHNTMSSSSSSNSSSEDEPFLFNNVELLSLYTTSVLQQLVTSVQPTEDRLRQLIQVLEYNLNNMEVERKWFFGTLRDHARLLNREWTMGNTDGPDIGKVAYNTLLLVVALRLGLEKLWVSDGNTPLINSLLIDELTALYQPNKISLSLKELNKSDPLFDFLSNHSPGLEEIIMFRSDVPAFQDCMKFKNLRVLKLGGRIADKVLCSTLWGVNKKSDKVLEMALKDSKGPESWQLTLPNLKVLQNNVFGDHDSNSMRVSLGAAALLIQPHMESVETLTWDTYIAILHLLNTEAKLKNSMTINRKFQLKGMKVRYNCPKDLPELQRIFTACPNISILNLYMSGSPAKPFIETINVKHLKKLMMDVLHLEKDEFLSLLSSMLNLTELFLVVTPDWVVRLASHVATVSDPYSDQKLQVHLRTTLPSGIETLTMDFLASDSNIEASLENEEFAAHMIDFLQNFPSVKTMYFSDTVFLPPTYVVFGCVGGALATLRKMKHMKITACVEFSEAFRPHELTLHAVRTAALFPLLQKDTTFQYLRTLETLELDEQYLSPRVDRMVAALRTAGVLVNGNYHSEDFAVDFGDIAEK